jgi:MFS family permease
MASRTENAVVNVAGLVQGIVLVTFPALSTIFTKTSEYGLSSTQYGGLFLPQVVTAVATSLLGSALARRISTKRVYLLGLACSTVSMGLLIASTGVKTDQAIAYPLLLVATAFLGAGFGLTVPVLNTYASVFHPDGVDRAVLVLNALLGLGTALAPVFVAIFVGLGFWWGLPILSAAMLVALLMFSARLPLRAGERTAGSSGAAERTGQGVPARFWFFAAFAVLYGICETMNGNWSQLVLTTRVGASATQASLALAVFWGMVTVGRVVFAAVDRWLPDRVTYHILPFVLVVTFVLVAVLPRGDAGAGIAIFALAGLGCSALLPLTISFGEKDLAAMSAVAGGIIAFYQVGYGIAAFGVGPLQRTGLSLSAIFGFTAIVAAVLGMLSFAVVPVRSRPSRPATPDVTPGHPAPHGLSAQKIILRGRCRMRIVIKR